MVEREHMQRRDATMTMQEKVIKNKVGLLKLGKELGNVSRACKATHGIASTVSRSSTTEEESSHYRN